ncbi:response regulator [Patescibacteria group bacterium]|nr:response regulator [Patescibacteria group bacterium]MBU1500508.1 response regulator [Patescibacteria group bacterium]MBU2080693.1 response regulator [Patescibacteria group bacterium]MBU2123798.1 response regulator [Patescibacteria group bacterium]MBU2194911.1 response regulator [Patescibacteria group bacterium]
MATSYRIYLVDDDRFLLDMYAVKFRTAGHEVTAFAGGEDVLAALRENPAPDAVLLDIVMPGLDGFQILETVKREQLAKTSKLIVLSNQGQESDITRAKELGASGYIIKASAIPSEVFSETIAIIEKTA